MRTLVVVALVAMVGCKKEQPEAAAPVNAATKKPSLTFFITGAENGYLLPTPTEGSSQGGAAETLSRWHAQTPKDGPPPIVLSTGDNANGAAISSYFKGESTAQVMRLMGYTASALGNRELDWSREQFTKNTETGGFAYLAANLTASDAEGTKLGLKPYVVVSRGETKVGIIGLSSHKALVTPMPGRMAGLTVRKDAEALGDAVAAAKAEGASILGVVSDGCLDEVPALLDGHEGWALSFFAARKCEAAYPETVGPTRLVYPGRHFNEYAKVVVDPDAFAKVSVEAVQVVNDGTVPPDAQAAALIAGWQRKLDDALGGTIGFSKAGIEQESKEMSAWLTTSLREQFKTDVALLNRKGVRQSLPAGPITKATVYDLIPFDNQIVVVKVKGSALLEALANVQARVAGVKAKGDSFIDATGAPIVATKTYSVATIDYLYLGGDGFALQAADPSPTMTNSSWQAALTEWTEAQKSTEQRPLETLIKVK